MKPVLFQKQLAPFAQKAQTALARPLATILSRNRGPVSQKDYNAMMSRLMEMEGKGYEYIERISKLPIHKFTDYQSYIDAGCARVWATFRACHLVASVLQKVKIKIVDIKGSQPREIKNHPLGLMLAQPNPEDSWEQLLYQLVFHLKLCGNGYWLKDQQNAHGQPLAIYSLLPQYVEVIPDAKKRIAGYRYKINGRVIDYDPSEIIHFRRPHPNDNIMGLGDIEPGEALFNQFINRDTYGERFMENGAQPSGMLIKEEAVEDEREWLKVKRWWDANYSGKKNIGKTAFLNGKWEYVQLGLDMQKMQNIEAAKLNTEQIFMLHGVPLSIAGVRESANYATARQEDINFRNFECEPLMSLIVGTLNGNDRVGAPGLTQAFGDNIQIDYELGGLINVEQLSKDYELGVKYGAISLNEYRVLMGLAKSDNPFHDQCFVDATRLPIEMAGLSAIDPASLDGPGNQPALPPARRANPNN